MENRAHAIVAVTFLIVFSTGAIVIYYWLANRSHEPLVYTIVTDLSVGGLAAQSEVRFKGLVVGHVSGIRFNPDDRSEVIIHIRLEPNTYVTQATYAVVARQGLAGGSMLQLKLGEGSDQPLTTSPADPARIPLRKGLLATLASSARQNLQTLQDVLADARKLLSADNREHVAATLAHIDSATGKLAAIADQLLPVVRQLPALLQALQHSLEQSQELLTRANRLASAAQKPLRKAAELESAMQALARSSRQLSERLQRQAVPDLAALSRRMQRTLRQLNALLRELKANPQSLIFGPPAQRPGPGEPGFGSESTQP